MRKKMITKILAIALVTTTVLQTTGITSKILDGEAFITVNAKTIAPSRVAISGTEKVDKTLTANLYADNTLVTTSAGATFKWYRIDNNDDHKSKSDIKNGKLLSETDKTYKLVSSDKNDYIGVIATYNGSEFYDITGDIGAKSNSNSNNNDSNDSNDNDTLDELKLLNKDNSNIKLYSNDNYEDEVNSDKVDEGNTYYAKTSSNEISINIDGADEDKVRIFKEDSETAYKVGNNINISNGTTILKVRVYEDNYSDYDDYDEANDSSYDEYKIQVKCTTTGTTTTTTTGTGTGTATNANTTVGWTKNNATGIWTYKNASGELLTTQWLYDNNIWYYLKSDSSMATGWLLNNNAWYFLNSSGAMKTGWVQVESKWYFLNENGAMASNTYVGGYQVGNDGAWIK